MGLCVHCVLTNTLPGRPTEYAQAVLGLAVNEYMNGSTVLIDGGWLLEQS